MTSLNERAVLVNLVVHMWTNQRADAKAAKVVEERFQLEKSQDRYMKVLIDNNALQDIRRTGSRLRQLHYRYTLPWQDDGVRILPSRLFMTYMNEMTELKNEFSQHVDTLIEQYPTYRAAAAQNKKGLFDEHDYPEAHELRGMFGVETNFLPFPSAHDFRIDIDDDGALAKLKAEAEQAYAKATKNAMTAYLGGVLDRLTRLTNVLTVVQQSSIDALKGQVGLLPSMNLLENTTITEVHGLLNGLLDLYTAEEIRENGQTRGLVYDAFERSIRLIREMK